MTRRADAKEVSGFSRGRRRRRWAGELIGGGGGCDFLFASMWEHDVVVFDVHAALLCLGVVVVWVTHVYTMYSIIKKYQSQVIAPATSDAYQLVERQMLVVALTALCAIFHTMALFILYRHPYVESTCWLYALVCACAMTTWTPCATVFLKRVRCSFCGVTCAALLCIFQSLCGCAACSDTTKDAEVVYDLAAVYIAAGFVVGVSSCFLNCVLLVLTG